VTSPAIGPYGTPVLQFFAGIVTRDLDTQHETTKTA
jgi:hypothetical protein